MSESETTNPTGLTRLYGSVPQTPLEVLAHRVEVVEASLRTLKEELRAMRPVVEEHEDRLDGHDSGAESMQRLLSATQSAVIRMEADISRLVDSVTTGQLVIEGRLRRMMAHMGVDPK
jgi:chromosome segregation ATPase